MWDLGKRSSPSAANGLFYDQFPVAFKGNDYADDETPELVLLRNVRPSVPRDDPYYYMAL